MFRGETYERFLQLHPLAVNCISTRLEEHNRGGCRAARFTARTDLRPFGLLAYITGFEHRGDRELNHEDRLRIESLWDSTTASLSNGRSSPDDVLNAWPVVFEHVKQESRFGQLLLVQCAELRVQQRVPEGSI